MAKARSKKNDIRIGPATWLESEAPDPRNAVNIDAQLTPVTCFLESLATGCVPECCGIQAFEFSPKQITKAFFTNSGNNLSFELKAVIEKLEQIEAHTFCSTVVNDCVKKETLIELLQHLRKNIEAHAF